MVSKAFIRISRDFGLVGFHPFKVKVESFSSSALKYMECLKVLILADGIPGQLIYKDLPSFLYHLT